MKKNKTLVKYKVEADVDLWLYSIASGVSDYCTNKAYEFKIKENNRALQDLFVRYVNHENSKANAADLSGFVLDFLSGLENLLACSKYMKGELRLGIYYDLESIMACSVCLSDEVIRKLSQYNLSFESILYPCSDFN